MPGTLLHVGKLRKTFRLIFSLGNNEASFYSRVSTAINPGRKLLQNLDYLFDKGFEKFLDPCLTNFYLSFVGLGSLAYFRRRARSYLNARLLARGVRRFNIGT